MREEFKSQLAAHGVAVEHTLGRFMNQEDVYETFLKKVLEDENREHLLRSLDKDNIKDAFRYAHTLKGMTANLGLDSLAKCISPLVEKLRAGIYDVEAEKILQNFLSEYETIIKIISEEYA